MLFQELTPKLASALGVQASKGAVVTDLVPDGPASKSGLRKDDVIVGLNGKDTDGRSLRLAVGSMAPGTTIDLNVLRGSSQMKYSVTLDRMPEEPQRADDSQPAVPRFHRRG